MLSPKLRRTNEGRSEQVHLFARQMPQGSIFFLNARQGQALRVTRPKGERLTHSDRMNVSISEEASCCNLVSMMITYQPELWQTAKGAQGQSLLSLRIKAKPLCRLGDH